MQRRSLVEGLETLREAILGYDAASDPKGTAWDELRVELDTSVLGLIEKAEALPRYTMGVDLAMAPDAPAIAVVERSAARAELPVKFDAWPAFRSDLPADYRVQQFKGIAFVGSIDIAYNLCQDGTREVWGESDRARDFIDAKLKVRGRIGKHYRVGRSLAMVAKAHPTTDDLIAAATPYLLGKGPAEVDPFACLVTPQSEAGSIWLQNQARDGVEVMRHGKSLAEAER